MLLSVFIRFLIYFSHWMVLAHLPVIFMDYGLSNSQVGMFIAFFSVASMALMLPMGLFSDLFSPRRVLLVGAFAFAAYFFGLTQVMGFWPLLFLSLLGGFGAACLIVVSESLYLKQYGQQQQGKRVALYQVATYLGFGAGPLCGGLLLNWSTSALFWLAAAVSIAIGLLCLCLAENPPLRFSFRSYGTDLWQLRPLLLIGCILLLGSHFGVEQTSTALMMQSIGLNSAQIGQIFGLLGLWMAFIVPFIGWLKDRRDSLFVFLLVGIAISGFFQMITGLAHGYLSMLVIRACHTFGDAIALLELGVLVAFFFPAGRLGGNSGLLYCLRTFATFVAAILAGVLNQYLGYGATFLISGVSMLLFATAMGLYIVVNRERRQVMGWVSISFEK